MLRTGLSRGLLISIISLSGIIEAERSRPAQFPGASLSGAEPGEFSPAIRTGYTCEGEELLIECEEAKEIQIVRANYGRFSIAICNDDGKTHWSVNCMSPKTRHILQKKCDNQNSCSVPVSSELFGDPCPGTHKYVEIHYTCSHTNQPANARRPIPPWYLQQPSLHSNSELFLQEHLPPSSRHSSSDVGDTSLAPVDSGAGYQSNYNSRIPILVATTTPIPPRVPITTPKPIKITRTSIATTETVSADSVVSVDTEVTSKEVDVLLQQTNEVVINHESEHEEDTEMKVSSFALLPQDVETKIVQYGDNAIDETTHDVVVSEDTMFDYCSSMISRDLDWKMTRVGQVSIQPCPNGATGLARWTCESTPGGMAAWSGDQPDMSDCKSVMMTNLEVKVRQEDPENVIASSLARLTGSRQLYGGDLQSAVAVIRTVASRIQYLLQQKSENFYKKEAFIQEVLLNVVRSASNLLDVKNREAWRDLEVQSQMKVASSLLSGVQENAGLWAEVISKTEILMESSYNILMAISVLNMKDIRNGSSFPLNNYEEPFGTIEDSIFLPLRALERNARDKLVKAVFFSFKHLDEILWQPDSFITPGTGPDSGHHLNSRLMSVSVGPNVGHDRHVLVTLGHVRPELGHPMCVSWSVVTDTWSDDSCHVMETNLTHTTCQCDLASSSVFALMMKEQSVPIVIHLPAFHVEIIVGAVISVLLLVLFLVLFKFRAQVQQMLKIPCSNGGKKGLEHCDKSQSFFNGINLMQSPGGEKSQTLSTNVVQSQARLSHYMLSSADHESSKYENISNDRYQDIQDSDSSATNQSTLPMRGQLSQAQTHVTINPYSTSLLGHGVPSAAGGQHIYQLAMSPQLSQLTNTLRQKKKCVLGHTGHSQSPHSSVRSDSLTPCVDMDTDTEIIPHSSDVVFRAVSPHGHVYWEIDPKRPSKIRMSPGGHGGSDEDTTNDLHNMSDFSEDDVSKVTGVSERSRGSSSRFSDHRPLLPSSSPCHVPRDQVTVMATVPELVQASHHNSYSPTHILSYSSLQKGSGPLTTPVQPQFLTRTRLSRPGHPRIRQDTETCHQTGHTTSETLQQQVQIPDLRRIPVSVKSSEYIMAKIQNHIDNTSHRNINQDINVLKEREV